jgi:uncharacterized protein with HEPN domain
MLTGRQRLRLEHIVENAARISSYVASLTYADFAADTKTIDAVERCLQRITEAAVRIGDETMASVAPAVPPQVYRGFGNALRHDYDQIDLHTVWLTATKDVPLLAEACERRLGSGD